MKTQASVRLHRFHGNLAIDFEDTETLYLTPKMVWWLANSLLDAETDLSTVKFTESKFGTRKIEIDPSTGEVTEQ